MYFDKISDIRGILHQVARQIIVSIIYIIWKKQKLSL
jgi:hypothetical protein